MKRSGWNAIARWRDERMGEDGDLWHRVIIDPTLLRVVGPVRRRRILDLACGNGYLTRRWARAGAAESIGVDLSSRSVALARSRERARPSGARFLCRDARELRGLDDAQFDLVVANMALDNIRDLRGAVGEVARVLAPDGRFVFSISHPCFDLDDRSGWAVEWMASDGRPAHEVIWRKMRAYREERPVTAAWRISERTTGYTIGFHRTLATFSRILREHGLAITRLEEPSPRPEAVRDRTPERFLTEIPLHLVVEARAHPALGPRGRRPTASRRASRRSAGTPGAAGRRSGSDARRPGSGSRRRASRTGS